MIFNYNLGPGGRYELEFVISSCIYKIDYFTIHVIEIVLIFNSFIFIFREIKKLFMQTKC